MKCTVIALLIFLTTSGAFAALHSSCGNGDFEAGLSPTEWEGGAGKVLPTGDPDFANFTPGLTPGMNPGPLTLVTSRHTWVGAGTDQTVGISEVAPVDVNGIAGGSTHAVRIGNAMPGAFSEMLSKTFVVTQSVIPFWYAVVFQDPQHAPHEQPSFWVRVLDASAIRSPAPSISATAPTSSSPIATTRFSGNSPTVRFSIATGAAPRSICRPTSGRSSPCSSSPRIAARGRILGMRMWTTSAASAARPIRPAAFN